LGEKSRRKGERAAPMQHTCTETTLFPKERKDPTATVDSSLRKDNPRTHRFFLFPLVYIGYTTFFSQKQRVSKMIRKMLKDDIGFITFYQAYFT
jgi:hypothetical protein